MRQDLPDQAERLARLHRVLFFGRVRAQVELPGPIGNLTQLFLHFRVRRVGLRRRPEMSGGRRQIMVRGKPPCNRRMTGRERPMRFPVVNRKTGETDVPTEVPDTVNRSERPVLEVGNLTTRFDLRSGAFGRVSGRVPTRGRVIVEWSPAMRSGHAHSVRHPGGASRHRLTSAVVS